MDTAALIQLAQERSLAEFVALHPGLYLVVSRDGGGGAPIAFETVAVATRPARSLDIERAAAGVEVLAVAKAPGNPYPERISLGRARNCDLVFRDASVSKLHAHFRVIGGDVTRLEVVDHGSHNGTRVAGTRLLANTPTAVKSGDALVFGRVATKLVDGAALYEALVVLGRVAAAGGEGGGARMA
jgi:hypothetical protein